MKGVEQPPEPRGQLINRSLVHQDFHQEACVEPCCHFSALPAVNWSGQLSCRPEASREAFLSHKLCWRASRHTLPSPSIGARSPWGASASFKPGFQPLAGPVFPPPCWRTNQQPVLSRHGAHVGVWWNASDASGRSANSELGRSVPLAPASRFPTGKSAESQVGHPRPPGTHPSTPPGAIDSRPICVTPAQRRGIGKRGFPSRPNPRSPSPRNQPAIPGQCFVPPAGPHRPSAPDNPERICFA